MPCVFCSLEPKLYLAENDMFYAIWDTRPVSKGHALLISKRHCADFFELLPAEAAKLHEFSLQVRTLIDALHQPQGYNLAMNCGREAGQSVFHFHLHIIPRYSNDKTKLYFPHAGMH